MTIRMRAPLALAAASALAIGGVAVAQDAPTTTTAGEVTVGGAAMLPSRTIVENAAQASNLTTLVRAVQAADLAETLSGAGPFTVFAPDDAAFGRLPPGTIDELTQPGQKANLTKILTYHVVPGRVDAATLTAQIESGGGTATLTTVEGQPLTARILNGNIELTDTVGNKSYVTQADVPQSNGVVHVVNGVVFPKLT